MSEQWEVNKIAMVVPVSEQLLADAFAIPDAFINPKPDTRTPREREIDEARRRNAVRQMKDKIRAEHTATLAAFTDPTLTALLNLHGPEFYGDYDDQPHCDGCDIDGYEAEAPPFPCRTYELITDLST